MFTALKMRLKEEMTPLVAFGLIALVCIFAFLSLNKLAEATQALEVNVITAQTDLLTLQQLQGEDVWDKRLATSSTELTKMQSKIWEGPTPGVISAYLDETLVQILNTLDAERTLVRVDPEPQLLNTTDILSFEMRGQLPSHLDAIDFLASVEGNPRKIWITDTSVSFSGNGVGSITMSGVIPIRIIPEEAGENG